VSECTLVSCRIRSLVLPYLALPSSLRVLQGVISGIAREETPSRTYKIDASNVGGVIHTTVQLATVLAAPYALGYDRENGISYVINLDIVCNEPRIVGEQLAFSVDPELPDGLSIDADSGAICGHPTTLTERLTYTVTAVNAGGSSSVGLDIAVVPPPPSRVGYSSQHPTVTVGQQFSLTPVMEGTTDPEVSWSIGPPLPEGVSVSVRGRFNIV
jgi:hypothetical protein